MCATPLSQETSVILCGRDEGQSEWAIGSDKYVGEVREYKSDRERMINKKDRWWWVLEHAVERGTNGGYDDSGRD